MFFDPFTFTPPHPARLPRAVESYQRVAASRFCRYARDAMNPDLLPLKVRGELLDPTPKQLHAEVRALRHLTAIQRTLRDIGGPLFDPASPIAPEKRFQLVERRLEAIHDALGDRPFADSTPGTPSACSESFSSDFKSSSSADKPSFYHPPEIEDLLEAVNFAQIVFAARAELLDKRRLKLSPEDFLLEIASLRDLTSIVRTLRRMSAKPLQEDETHADFQKEATARPDAPSSPASDSSDPSYPPHRSHMSYDPSRQAESVKSVGGAASDSALLFSDEMPATSSQATNETGLIDSLAADRPLRPVPRVPEVRAITPRNGSATSSEPAKPLDHAGDAGPHRPLPCHVSNPLSTDEYSDPLAEVPNPESSIPNPHSAPPFVLNQPHPRPIPDDP